MTTTDLPLEAPTVGIGHSRLSHDQRAAVDAYVSGGVVEWLQRIRQGHGPHFGHTRHIDEGYPNGVVYTGCVCGETGCSYPLFLVHISDLVAAYEGKIQELAQETLRTPALVPVGIEWCETHGSGYAERPAEAQKCFMSLVLNSSVEPCRFVPLYRKENPT